MSGQGYNAASCRDRIHATTQSRNIRSVSGQFWDAVTGWLDDFHSGKLTSLVTEAVGNSYDLAATRSRVRQLEERAKIAGADRLPTLDSGIGTRRSQNLRGATFQTVRANTFDFSLDVTWEVDLWGRIKNLRDAELDKLIAETNVYEASRLSLAANVTKTAFEIVESKQQIALSRRRRRIL